MKRRKIGAILIPYGMFVNAATLNEQNLEKIRQAAPGAELMFVKDKEEWERKADYFSLKTEVVFGHLPSARFRELPNFILTNASGVHAIPISEHILALMLALARDIPFSLRQQTKRQWIRRGQVFELEGSTLGIIGLGKIGEKMAQKAKALKMRVLANRRNPERSSPYVDWMFGTEGLEELLSLSDWVVIAAPMTPETKGLIGEKELRGMKQSAYLINIARGSIVQEKALIRALQEGWIDGAGLDVFETEPLPEDSPLWEMENVIITCHYAGATPFNFDRVMEIFLENLGRYQRGEPLINQVDKQRGY